MKLIPENGFADRDIREIFSKLSDGAVVLKSAVAFHTLNPNLLGTEMGELWRRKSSFHCVDISTPTDLDLVADMVHSGMKVHIMLRKKDDDTDGFKGLLHTKIYLFEYPEEKVKILIGSHNFTQAAIYGINAEASLLHTCNTTDKLYNDMNDFLKEIKNKCEPFNLDKLEYYKKLQAKHSEHASAVIYLRTDIEIQLVNQVITIFGSIVEEYHDLKIVGKNIKLRVFHYGQNWSEQSFEAVVIQTGFLAEGNKNAAGLTFDARLHAFRETTNVPLIESKEIPNEARVSESVFFVNLQIVEKLPESIKYRSPDNKDIYWEKDSRFMKKNDNESEIAGIKIMKAVEADRVHSEFEGTEVASAKQTKFIERMIADYSKQI